MPEVSPAISLGSSGVSHHGRSAALNGSIASSGIKSLFKTAENPLIKGAPHVQSHINNVVNKIFTGQQVSPFKEVGSIKVISPSVKQKDQSPAKLLDTPANNKVDGYFTDAWESMSADWNELASDFDKTNSHWKDQSIKSTLFQQAGNVVDFGVDLVGSVISNDQTKAWAGDAIDSVTQTGCYQSAKQALTEIADDAVDVIEHYLEQSPQFKEALFNVADQGMGAGQFLANEAKQIAESHPEAMRNLGAVGDIIQLAGVGKAAQLGIRGGSQMLNTGLNVTKHVGTDTSKTFGIKNTADDLAYKLSFDPSLNIIDKHFASEASKILADNSVGSASYSRLLRQGTNVKFINDANMPSMGEFNPNRNLVIVNMLHHASAKDVASTVIHEATHQNGFFRGIPQNTQLTEYKAFRNESLFTEGRRPSLQERREIWDFVKDAYSSLPQGKSPFGDRK